MKGDLDQALRDCLAGLDTGETEATCLARYPEWAAELAPMLAAADQLRALRGSELTPGARLQARATLHRAAAHRTAIRRRPKAVLSWLPWGKPARALAGLAAAVLLVVLSAGMVAASRPGDLAYPLRVEIERVPVWFAPAGPERTAAELALAARRLNDLQMGLSSGRGADGTAIAALFEADSAAARQAAEGDASLRDMVVQRIRSQAGILEGLAAASPDPEGSSSLRLAAQRALALVGGLAESGSGQGDPRSQPEGPVTGGQAASGPTVTRSPQPAATPYPSSTQAAIRTPGAPHEASSTPEPDGKSWQTAGPHGTPDPTGTAGHGATSGPSGSGPRSLTAAPSASPALSQTPAPAPAPTAASAGSGSQPTSAPGSQPPGPVRTSAPGPQPPGPQPTSPGQGGPGVPPTSYPGGGSGNGSGNGSTAGTGSGGAGAAASPSAPATGGASARATPQR